MLALTRKVGESIVIDDSIRITVVAVEQGQVRIAIDAPRDIAVHRSEVYDAIVRPRTPPAT
jgi:carbon storage regulator